MWPVEVIGRSHPPCPGPANPSCGNLGSFSVVSSSHVHVNERCPKCSRRASRGAKIVAAQVAYSDNQRTEDQMRIRFEVAGTPCEYHRNPFLGGARLRVGPEVMALQGAIDPRTQIGFTLSRAWERSFDGHTIRIEKDRPLLLAGLRPQRYRVLVDGQLVADESGF